MNLAEKAISKILKFFSPPRAKSLSLRNPNVQPIVLKKSLWITPEFQLFKTTDVTGLLVNEYHFARGETFVYQVARCSLVSPQGIVFLGDYAVEESNFRGGGASDAVTMMRAWPKPKQGNRRQLSQTGQLLATETPKFFLNAPFENYYHFLLECLPKLLQVLCIYPDTLVIVAAKQPRFVEKFLSSSGLDFIEVSDGTWNVASLSIAEREPYAPLVKEEISLLRNEFLRGRSTEKQDRMLYVSRVGSKRSLQNEDSLEQFLVELGFQILRDYDLEDIYKNAEVFSNAAIVIGPHGAGLANIVFCAPGAEIYELATSNWWNPAFSSLALGCGLSHHLVTLPTKDLMDYGQAFDAIKILRKLDLPLRGMK